MKRIAVLFTCFNRKDKTIKALRHLFASHDPINTALDLQVFLTDDGSTDGTSQAVKEAYPQVKVLQGTGSLYWAGGMRNSWNAALNEGTYDAYLLLNDDTYVYKTLFSELLETHDYSLKNFNQAGIYVGSTKDLKTNAPTYGGSIFTSKFLARYVQVKPNGKIPQRCELGNANIMLVHQDVVSQIGILADSFKHGLADFDYTLKATKRNIPVLITANFLGECERDKRDIYSYFHTLSLKKRIKLLYNPIGLDFQSNLEYMKRNFPYRLPFVFIAGWFKVLFPKLYLIRRIGV